MSYYEKYLKYKNKYVTLKKQIGGNHCKTLLGFNKYKGCEALKNGCKIGDFNYEIIPAKNIEETNDKETYNTNLKKEILECKPTLKQLLDAGYTIKDINKFVLVPFTFPDIVEYNVTATKKIVFNDMNKLNFGQLKTSYSDEDKYKFTTCYDKFDYSNLTKESVNSINNIISNFWDSNLKQNEIENYKYLKMIIYFAKIILSKDLVDKNGININELGTSKYLREHLLKYKHI
jgi:hypothetical protein